MSRHLFTLAALCCIAGSAVATGPIYRCGADGRVFSQTPCPHGTLVETAAPPSPEQQAEAQRVADQDRRLADEMESSRRAEEAALKPKRAAALTRPSRKTEREARDPDDKSKNWYRKPHRTQTKQKARKEPGVILLRPASPGK